MRFVSGVRRFVPAFGAAAALLALLAGGVFGGMVSGEKIIRAIDGSRLFTVGKISVRGNQRLDDAAVIKRCGIAPSMKVYRVKKAAISTALLADPWIEKARCATRWWGTVAIEIKERTPIALVNTGEVRLIDKSGVLLPVEPGKTYDLPLISALMTSVDGKGNRCPDSSSIARAGGFIARACAADGTIFRRITQLDIRNTGHVRCLVAGQPIVIDMEYDADMKQLRNLRYLLETLANGAPVATIIDLRYHNLAFVCRVPSASPHQPGVND